MSSTKKHQLNQPSSLHLICVKESLREQILEKIVPLKTMKTLRKHAKKIGFPVMDMFDFGMKEWAKSLDADTGSPHPAIKNSKISVGSNSEHGHQS